MVDGGKSSHMKMSTSSTGRARNALMLQETRTLKELQFKYGTDTTVTIKDGKFSILTKQRRLQLKDSVKNTDSISTDHSTLSQDFQ